jgi:hypothetical protein
MADATPYVKNDKRPLIQHKTNDGWIAWNWDRPGWDQLKEPITALATGERHD